MGHIYHKYIYQSLLITTSETEYDIPGGILYLNQCYYLQHSDKSLLFISLNIIFYDSSETNRGLITDTI